VEDVGLDPNAEPGEEATTASEPGNLASVIIPAHNEEATIAACLDAVLASELSAGQVSDLDIVVVANGCTDRTAAIVAGYGPGVRLIDTPVGSKANALELGRVATQSGNRIYLDADIVVSTDAIESVIAALNSDGVEGSAPRIDLAQPQSASLPLRHYARIWEQAPYFGPGLIGSGFYGLTEEAQTRIGGWPSLIADDLVALCHLKPQERQTAAGWFRHTLPSRLRDVAKVEVRREAGRMEFAAWAQAEGRSVAEESPGGNWLGELARSPMNWPGLGLFVAVKVVAKIRAKRAVDGGNIAWGQDQHGRSLRASDADSK
jgi:glycosyltransferase involved in cell wall biosynthesis